MNTSSFLPAESPSRSVDVTVTQYILEWERSGPDHKVTYMLIPGHLTALWQSEILSTLISVNDTSGYFESIIFSWKCGGDDLNLLQSPFSTFPDVQISALCKIKETHSFSPFFFFSFSLSGCYFSLDFPPHHLNLHHLLFAPWCLNVVYIHSTVKMFFF